MTNHSFLLTVELMQLIVLAKFNAYGVLDVYVDIVFISSFVANMDSERSHLFVWKTCQRHYITRSGLYKHRQSSHPEVSMTPRGDTPFRFHALTEPRRTASSERYAEESAVNTPFKTPYGSQFKNITLTSQSPQVEPKSVDNSSLQSQLTLRAIAECAGIVSETPWNELVDEVCNLTPAHSKLTPEMSEGI